MATRLRKSDGTRATGDVLGQRSVQVAISTIATSAGNNDFYAIAPITGVLISAVFSATDALAAHDTNNLTFGITNLGQAGAGTNPMLAASDANTTKATGGTALAAHTKRDLTLHGTAANKNTVKNDRLRFRIVAAGTLNNAVSGGVLLLTFQ